MEELRERKEGLINKKEYEKKAAEGLLSDPLQVNSFLKLYDFMVEKAIPKYRKMAFESMLKSEKYDREGDVFFMQGSACSETERQTAMKLTSAGFYVVFPGKGQLKDIKLREKAADLRSNDAYLYDKRTYYQVKVDLKTVNSGSAATIASHIAGGSGQAPVIALDVQGGTNRWSLIKGIRSGWSSSTKRILLSWRGQWYDIDKNRAKGKKREYRQWLENNLK